METPFREPSRTDLEPYERNRNLFQVSHLTSLGLRVSSLETLASDVRLSAGTANPDYLRDRQIPWLWILDQTALPHQELWTPIWDVDQMVEQIHSLRIRGAPLIGVGAALAFALLCRTLPTCREARTWLEKLGNARPTAINLQNALARLSPILKTVPPDATLRTETVQALINTATELFYEDVRLCEGMAQSGLSAIDPNDTILTICNTGGLATVGAGTALSVIKKAARELAGIQVIACETRPLLQGARLTAWELNQEKIPFRLICDSMAADMMRKGRVQKILVGADRIALNGDFANKVGTYSLAVLARHHKIPFFVVAPYTTLSRQTPSGDQIPIEERQSGEILGPWTLQTYSVYNPSFDVTPADLVDGYILDSGLYSAMDVRLGALHDLASPGAPAPSA